MMKLPTAITALAATVALCAPVTAMANDSSAIAIEGSYFLVQSDARQRVLQLDRGGNVVVTSDLEGSIGFTAGLGSWRATGSGSATATVVDFNTRRDDDRNPGPSVTVFELTFSDEQSGRFQTVSGTLSGRAYASGQNPFDQAQDPVRTYSIEFSGSRVPAE